MRLSKTVFPRMQGIPLALSTDVLHLENAKGGPNPGPPFICKACLAGI